jgi:ribonuclease HII
MMQQLDRCYPGFHLGAHKGYSTPAHLEALRSREPSPLHRRSFSPVRVAFEAVTSALDGSVSQCLTGTSDEI